MWRKLAKEASSRKINLSAPLLSSSSSGTAPLEPRRIITQLHDSLHSVGFPQFGLLPTRNYGSMALGRLPIEFSSSSGHLRAYYGSVAEAVISEEESSGCDETQELLDELNKQARIGAQQQQQGSIIKQQQKKKTIGGIGKTKYLTLKRRQIKMETEAWEEAAKEYQELLTDMCQQKLAPNLPYIKSLFLGWFEPLRDAISAEQELCKQKKVKPSHWPNFGCLPPDMMAVITMHKLMGLVLTSNGGPGSCRVVQAACQIGEAIEHEAMLHRFLQKKTTKSKTPDEESNSQTSEDPSDTVEGKESKDQARLRKKVNMLLKKQKVKQIQGIVKAQDDCKPWGQENQVKVGCRLIQLLTETAYIQPPVDQSGDSPPDIRPAFVHALKNVTKDEKNRRYGIIECDPLVRRGLEKSARHMVIPYMPMLVPPVNWTGYDKGAHLFLPSYIMRTHGAKQQREAVKRTPVKQLEPVFEALNTLGNTKWKINKRVLSVVDRIWGNGGSLAGLVDREDVPLPEEPDTEDVEVLQKWRWKVKSLKKENSEKHSQRCDIELKLAVARKMKDEDGFYYPHNLDFRGRAYPMHPYLNHLGSDLCRGTLEFAEGRPLGKSGLRWLKIHVANLYASGGVDKRSFDGRVEFTEGHLDEIFDSADRPLEGKRWWLGAEDPFQCLAACINLTEALRSQSPETWISHMPVHQDGSCNGLQHYAALGRDKLGAAAVNLVAGDKPADVYSGIASRVLEIMRVDAEKDPATHPIAGYARLLINEVDRKLVKQTVMTSVYGVTYIGARDQIFKRLKERGAIVDNTQMFGAACYAAKTTLTALEEMFQAARSIMDWLGECARLIAAMNQPVRWITPLGLPVVQPYRHLGRHLIKTSLQVLTLQRETDKVMVKRQRTAFPPNFVHSLDGSHMMMTALACKKEGLSFAGVHDSYWTHACDVDKMNQILREKFVELYDAPILENLLESFQKTFPTLNFPPLPCRGDFDMKEVLESPYFFN